MQQVAPLEREATTIDISANLLQGFFDEKQSDSRNKSRSRARTVTVLLGCALWFGFLGNHAYHSAEEQDRLNQIVKKEKAILADVRKSSRGADVPDEVLALPAQYQASNQLLVTRFAHILTSSGAGQSLQSLRYAEEKLGEPKFVGQAETTNILTVRALLDEVQAARPDLEGMITSVSQPQGSGQATFNVSFELRPIAGAKTEVKP